jgi:hypothetical protein
MRSTHTYAILEISPEAHAEIKAKLLVAGYGDQIDGETIDMHGIAVEPEKRGEPITIGPTGLTFEQVCAGYQGSGTDVIDRIVEAREEFRNVKRNGDKISGEITVKWPDDFRNFSHQSATLEKL